jgi:hypothetical protein
MTAIKVFRRRENYLNELGCYQRLKERNVTKIKGFDVPKLVGYDDDLLVVEMDIVNPPCVIDFGKAYLDKKPPYSEEQLAESNERQAELWEDWEGRWEIVESIVWSLEGLGIYYLDAKPGNIMFKD